MPKQDWKPNQQKFGLKYKLIGKDYPTPDLYAKVTGQSKYAEDFRVDGMEKSPAVYGKIGRATAEV